MSNKPKRKMSLDLLESKADHLIRRTIQDFTIREILALFRGSETPEAEQKHIGWQICVLDRGFVYAGDVTITGQFVEIENAQNVRQWGTTRGLGELAELGPRPATRLDPAPTVRCTLKSVVHFIETDSSKWPQTRS